MVLAVLITVISRGKRLNVQRCTANNATSETICDHRVFEVETIGTWSGPIIVFWGAKRYIRKMSGYVT